MFRWSPGLDANLELFIYVYIVICWLTWKFFSAQFTFIANETFILKHRDIIRKKLWNIENCCWLKEFLL